MDICTNLLEFCAYVSKYAQLMLKDMKKTAIKRIGKVGRRNIEANKILKMLFEELEIEWCEKCGRNDRVLTPAHLHKREWYRPAERQKLLYSKHHVLCLCVECHNEIEVSREKTDELFNRLRPIYE